jgi:hypothetical protein
MNQSPRTWQWKCPAPVRADAESVFVPCSAVPDGALLWVGRVQRFEFVLRFWDLRGFGCAMG